MTTLAEPRLKRIDAQVRRILARVEHTSAADLHRDPADGWSPMRILAHAAELIAYWGRQAEELARRERDGEPFGRTAEDPERIAAVERHADDDLAQASAGAQAALDDLAVRLRGIPEAGWKRTGRHARRGEMSVERVIDEFVIDHLDEHAAQLDTALRGSSR